MKYISTRGEDADLNFESVLLKGLAPDGGLYLPKEWPHFTPDLLKSLSGASYQDLAVAVILPFVEPCLSEEEVRSLVEKAYASFAHSAIAPLKQLDQNRWVMELFHGSTLAFKDYALSLVGHLFDHVLNKQNQKITIVGATSGDTGSAAISACEGREAIDIFILHPKGRTSDIQRKQMTTVHSPNVFNIALEGSFDDCQDLVKALFNDREFREEMNLSAVNSINWARIMGQIVYYFHAALALGAPDRSLNFSVPTGNFGNVFAGYAAKKMGLPIERLMIGSNANDILTRYIQQNDMSMRPVLPTLSPSMDIQISSNFERLLFEMLERDGAKTANLITEFRETGKLSSESLVWKKCKAVFEAFSLDDEETLSAIQQNYQETGEVFDPHSVIAVEAAKHLSSKDLPNVSLATAHPSKFPDAMAQALGYRPALPGRIGDILHKEEHYTVLANNLELVKSHIRGQSRWAT